MGTGQHIFILAEKGGRAVAEGNGTEASALLAGQAGQEAMQMIQRVQRLQRLMGTEKAPLGKPKGEAGGGMDRSRKENIISAAIPFLDREYQRDLYVVVRLMEMQRVLGGGLLEARERQEEPAALRQRKLLRAVQTYLPAGEQEQLRRLLQYLDMKELLKGEENR